MAADIAFGIEYLGRLYRLAGPNIGLEGFVTARGGTEADLCTSSPSSRSRPQR